MTHVRHVAFRHFSFQHAASRTFLLFSDLMDNLFQLATAHFAFLICLTEMTETTGAPKGAGGSDRGSPRCPKFMVHVNAAALTRAPTEEIAMNSEH